MREYGLGGRGGSAFPGTLEDEVNFDGSVGPKGKGRALLGTPISDASLLEESEPLWAVVPVASSRGSLGAESGVRAQQAVLGATIPG